MARKLAAKTGQKVYTRRKVIVEPIFGQMSTLQNAKHLLLRGIDQARGEWRGVECASRALSVHQGRRPAAVVALTAQ